MTARSIKRRNAKRMTREFRDSVWWLFGAPAHRKPGALLDMRLDGDAAPD